MPIVPPLTLRPVKRWARSRRMPEKFWFQWLRNWSRSWPASLVVYGSAEVLRTTMPVSWIVTSTSRT